MAIEMGMVGVMAVFGMAWVQGVFNQSIVNHNAVQNTGI
jgi:hypothetical protein